MNCSSMVYLLPSDVERNEKRFEKSAKNHCFKLSEIAKIMTDKLDGSRQRLSAQEFEVGTKCSC